MSVNLGRVAYVEKGKYKSDTTYESKDVVSFNGGSYVFIGDAPAANVPPTDEARWQPLIDPTAMNEKIAEMDGVKQEALAAAETANTAAQRADEARESFRADLNGKASVIINDASGEIVHITDGADGMPVQRLITHVAPVQKGSGDPSPDNVRPISGWDSVSAYRTRKNLMPPGSKETYTGGGITFTRNDDGTYTVDGTATASSYYGGSTGPISLGVLPAGAYRISISPVSAAASVTANVRNKTNSNAFVTSTGASTGTASFTADGVSEYSAGFYVPNGKTVDNLTLSIQVEFGTVQTDHEPYQGQTLTADLPETLYGFDINWTTGLVSGIHNVVVLDGVTVGKKVVNVGTSYGAYYGSIGIKEADFSHRDRAISNYFVCDRINIRQGVHYISGPKNDTWIIYPPAAVGETVVSVNAWLAEQYAAGTPVTLVYKTAEPYTIQLTPQQMETLKGTNNIWSNAGATEVTYAADTKLYIDGKIAAIAAAIVNE